MGDERLPAAVDNAAPKSGTVNVLILDDNGGDRLLLAEMLDAAGLNCAITEAADLGAFAAALDERAYEIVFMDHSLGRHTGFDALDLLIEHPDQRASAPVMITGAGEIQVAVEAMRRGCTDYLTKDTINVDVLRKSITQAVEKKLLLTALSRETEMRVEVQRALERISRACAQDLRSHLSTMLRQLRVLRREDGTDPHAVVDLERTCDQMWEFLNGMHTYFRIEAGDEPKSLAA